MRFSKIAGIALATVLSTSHTASAADPDPNFLGHVDDVYLTQRWVLNPTERPSDGNRCRAGEIPVVHGSAEAYSQRNQSGLDWSRVKDVAPKQGWNGEWGIIAGTTTTGDASVLVGCAPRNRIVGQALQPPAVQTTTTPAVSQANVAPSQLANGRLVITHPGYWKGPSPDQCAAWMSAPHSGRIRNCVPGEWVPARTEVIDAPVRELSQPAKMPSAQPGDPEETRLPLQFVPGPGAPTAPAE